MMRALIRALFIRERYIRQWVRERQDVGDRLHRLETQNREIKDRLDQQEELLERLRNRQSGARGGRPPKVPDAADPLQGIPPGDKAALRRHFGIVK